MTDRIVALCTFLLAAVYLYATWHIPAQNIGDPLGPKAFPTLLGAGLVLSTLLLLIETARANGGVRKKEDVTESEKGNRHLLLVWAVVVWTIVFILLFEPVGFLLSSFLYLFVLLAYFNRKKWLTNVIISAGFNLAIYVLFAKFLGVTLAKGILYF